MRQLFINGSFITMDEKKPEAEAVLVENGFISEVFQTKPALKDVDCIDLEGNFVYPGLIDTHTHSFEGGLYSLGVDLGECRSLEEVFCALKKAVPLAGKIFAYNYDENLVKEERFPSTEELDNISTENCILLRRIDGHSCVINSKALNEIYIDTRISLKKGILKSNDNNTASYWFHGSLDDEAILKAYQQANDLALRAGITTLHTMIGDGGDDLLHYKLIADNLSQFTVDYILYPQIFSVEKAIEAGAERIGGCILADGSFGSYTAALKKAYFDRPDCLGKLYHSDEFWRNFISKAHRNSLQVAVHCIGDRAISQILNIYKELQINDFRNLRHQIIHNELNDDEMIKDFARYGITAVMQPVFDRLWGGDINYTTRKKGLYSKVLGKERALSCNRFRSLLDKGVIVAGSSDWYVTELDAIKGVTSAVYHHNPEERITPFEALKLYTSNAAAISFDDNRRGTIKKGALADFVCLDFDLLDCLSDNDQSFSHSVIKQVFKNGKKVV